MVFFGLDAVFQWLLSGHEHNYDDVRGEGFFGQTRRERRAYPSAVCEEASNEVGPKKNGRPKGCAEFGLWLRCSSVTDPLWDMLPPRVLPQAKCGATLRAAVLFRPDFVARSSQIHFGICSSLPPRLTKKSLAANVIVFMFLTT